MIIDNFHFLPTVFFFFSRFVFFVAFSRSDIIGPATQALGTGRQETGSWHSESRTYLLVLDAILYPLSSIHHAQMEERTQMGIFARRTCMRAGGLAFGDLSCLTTPLIAA